MKPVLTPEQRKQRRLERARRIWTETNLPSIVELRGGSTWCRCKRCVRYARLKRMESEIAAWARRVLREAGELKGG